MWLIDTDDVSLKDSAKLEGNVVYTILSHRWGKDEVSFQDMRNGEADNRAAFPKLLNAVREAQNQGYQYIWIDTCCINKESSAELSEAINSMYKWYEKAAVCYVYLEDVSLVNETYEFENSQWFTRGWTLQELIAPRHVQFFDKHWRSIGTKSSLISCLSYLTGINPGILDKTKDLDDISIAQRMSWASKRMTTREEDIAYCLMGLFDVNMPLLYGEGKKAFIRLQQEIIQHTYDLSIFGWEMSTSRATGLLAESPEQFRYCEGNAVGGRKMEYEITPFAITNRGLTIELDLVPWSQDTYFAHLECGTCAIDHSTAQMQGIFLRRLLADDQYARISIKPSPSAEEVSGLSLVRPPRSRLFSAPPGWKKKVSIPQKLAAEQVKLCALDYDWRVHITFHETIRKAIFSSIRDRSWDPQKRIAFMKSGTCGAVAIIDFPDEEQNAVRVTLGFDKETNPICLIEDSIEEDHMPWSKDCESHGRPGCCLNTYCKIHALAGCWCFFDRFDFFNCQFRAIKTSERLRKNSHGLWALRGDRIGGTGIWQSRTGSEEDGSIIRFNRFIEQGKLSWNFWMDISKVFSVLTK